MAGQTEQIAGIGLGLGLDISEWLANVEKAKSSYSSLLKMAQQGGSLQGPAIPRAAPRASTVLSPTFGVSRGAVQALRVQTNQHLRTMAQSGQAVQVPVTLGRVPYGQMRTQIARGIGEVPVRIRLDPTGVAGIKSVLTAVLTQTAAGSRSPAAVANAAVPHRAGGGSTNRGTYVVNEVGREKYVPKALEDQIPTNVARQLPGGGGLAARLARARGETGSAEAWMPEWRRRGMAKDLTGRARGGIVEIGGPKQVWQAPGDGWIIPSRLASQVPGRAAGGPVTRDINGNFHDPETGAYITREEAERRQYQPSEAVYAGMTARGNRFASQVGTRGESSKSVRQSIADANVFASSMFSGRSTAASDPERLDRQRQMALNSANRTLERGLTPGSNIGGLAIGLFGGRQRAEARAEYAQKSREYELLSPKGTDAIQHWTEKVDEATHRQIVAQRKLTDLGNTAGTTKDALREARQSVALWGHNVADSARVLQKSSITRTEADSALARTKGGALSQFGAIQFAGISYQIGQQVASFLAGAAGDVMRPFIDTMTGFQSTTERVTATLAQQLPENGGQLGVTFAKAAQSAGLGGQATTFLQGVLGPSVVAKGAANAQGQASDLFRAAAGVGNAPTGLTGGYGGLFGSSLFAQQLGGGKGYEEQITGDLQSIGGRSYGVYGASGGGVGKYAPPPTTTIAASNAQATTLQHLDVVTQEMQSITDAADRYAKATGSKDKVEFKFFDSGAQYADEQKKAIAAAQAAGDTYAEQNARAGYGFFVNGQVASTPGQLNQALVASAGGTVIPSQQAVVQGLQPQLKAQVAQTALSTAFAIGGPGGQAGAGTIAGGIGLQVAANPFAAAGSGVDVNFQRKLAPQLKSVADLQDEISKQSVAAISDMGNVVNQNMGPVAALQFAMSVTQMGLVGKQITAITSDLANKQAAVGAAQYGNSLRIINRSISDARGLVSGQGATSGAGANLGAVERRQFVLQQQSEQLSIAQSQRQINFSVAAAGFQAPGQTGEQRAANIAEAKYEASIAQKQLDIQKQQVPLAATAFNVGAARSLTDLQAQKSINAQEYALSQEQVVDQKKVNALQTQMALSQQKAQKILDGAVGNWNSALSLAAQAAGQYGYALSGILTDIRTGIDQALGITPSTGTPSNQKHTGSGQNKATGALFNTTGSTDITVGEANTETVAILRNPHAMSLGAPAGGGGTPIQLNLTITGNNIRNEDDIDTLVRKVTAGVERALNTRGAMLGLRSLG